MIFKIEEQIEYCLTKTMKAPVGTNKWSISFKLFEGTIDVSY